MEDAQWDLFVKCKDSYSETWESLEQTFSNVAVSKNQTCVVVKVPRRDISNPTSFVVIGSHQKGAQKRMLIALFGGKAAVGKKWTIKGCLIDDDYSALKVRRV